MNAPVLRVQGLSIANLQKDRTGLEIPRDWEGGLSGGPCTNASTELIRKVYKEYGDRFAIAGIGVLVWAYFYSNKAPKLKKALIILSCVFGALLLLRLLFSVLSLWTGWALYPYFSVPHPYYWG